MSTDTVAAPKSAYRHRAAVWALGWKARALSVDAQARAVYSGHRTRGDPLPHPRGACRGRRHRVEVHRGLPGSRARTRPRDAAPGPVPASVGRARQPGPHRCHPVRGRVRRAVLPAGKDGYAASLNRDSHRAAGDTVLQVWRALWRDPDDFISVDAARLADPTRDWTEVGYRNRWGHD